MTTIEQDDVLLRRYLLGELPEEETEAVEERLLHEDGLFELAEAVEGDLLAACARGELSQAEQERIQWRLASTPSGRSSLALAGDLTTVSKEFPAYRPEAKVLPFPRRVFQAVRRHSVAASLFLMVALGGVAWQMSHPEVYTDIEIDSSTPQTRGADDSTLAYTVPKGNGLALRLKLEEEPSKRFTVVVRHGGEEIHRQKIDLAQNIDTPILLEADEAPAGYYEIDAIPENAPNEPIHLSLRLTRN